MTFYIISAKCLWDFFTVISLKNYFYTNSRNQRFTLFRKELTLVAEITNYNMKKLQQTGLKI